MRGAFRVAAVAVLAAWPYPLLADCVSCGAGGECFSVSPGFSGNCECKIRSLHGVAICKPSGVCDPNDATSCSDDQFPQGLTSSPISSSRGKIATPFLQDLAGKDPLLAGAVWAGIAEENSSSAPGSREVTGTMGQGRKGYTYRTLVQSLAENAVSLTIHVEEDGTGRARDYEGTVLDGGRSGSFVKVGVKGRSAVFSWDTRSPGGR
jgi:hypothetical protein